MFNYPRLADGLGLQLDPQTLTAVDTGEGLRD